MPGIDYTFEWSDTGPTGPAKPSFIVPDGEIDAPLWPTGPTGTTSLTLNGKGSINWGQDVQQDLLYLLENFSSPTGPANPTLGQLWYDNVNDTLNYFSISGPSFFALASQAYVAMNVAGVASFNTRTGVVALTSGDVTGALGFTPVGPTGSGATGPWNINAASATNVGVTSVTGPSGPLYPAFVSASSGNLPVEVSTGLTFNPSTNTLSTTNFVGSFTGNLTGTADNANNVLIIPVSNASTYYPTFVTATSGDLAVDVSGNLTFNPSTNNFGGVTINFVGNTALQAPGTNTSQLASCAFVKAALTSSAFGPGQTQHIQIVYPNAGYTRQNNVIYQAGTQPRHCFVSWGCNSGGAGLTVYCSATTPPTTVIGAGGGYNGPASCSFMVPSNYYYKVVGSGNFSGPTYWTEFS